MDRIKNFTDNKYGLAAVAPPLPNAKDPLFYITLMWLNESETPERYDTGVYFVNNSGQTLNFLKSDDRDNPTYDYSDVLPGEAVVVDKVHLIYMGDFLTQYDFFIRAKKMNIVNRQLTREVVDEHNQQEYSARLIFKNINSIENLPIYFKPYPIA